MQPRHQDGVPTVEHDHGPRACLGHRRDQLVLFVGQREGWLVDALGTFHVGEDHRGPCMPGGGDGRVEIGLPLLRGDPGQPDLDRAAARFDERRECRDRAGRDRDRVRTRRQVQVDAGVGEAVGGPA